MRKTDRRAVVRVRPFRARKSSKKVVFGGACAPINLPPEAITTRSQLRPRDRRQDVIADDEVIGRMSLAATQAVYLGAISAERS
jgi:hypothetical protein